MGVLGALAKIRGGYPGGWKEYARGSGRGSTPPFVQPTDPDDRRRHAVHLTPAGRETLGRAQEVAARALEDVLAPLDQRERDTLKRLLRKLAGLAA